MKLSLQIGHLVKSKLRRRGLISDIQERAGLERHTVSALLHNSAKYVSLEALGKICDYLIQEHGVDPARLPGALFAKRRDGFWSMLADRERFEFCLATRSHPEWPGVYYVTADDSHLHGMLLSQVSAQETVAPSEHAGEDVNARRHFPDPHLVAAPTRVKNTDGDWETVEGGREQARRIYTSFRDRAETSALIAIGSTKGQPLLDLMFSDMFSTQPHESQDHVKSPRNRSCPIYFWYRATDIAPVSLCGGHILYQRTHATEPGIYYETEDGSWECCPWVQDRHDVAFVYYAYRPNLGELQLACGGFSGRATRMLAARLVSVASKLGEPQYKAPHLEVGLFLVKFDIKPAKQRKGQDASPPEFDETVIALPESVLKRRLEKKRRKKH